MSLLIGHAWTDLTTEKPMHLLGQFNICVNQGILDPVTAHAAVFENESDAILFLSVDTEEIWSPPDCFGTGIPGNASLCFTFFL